MTSNPSLSRHLILSLIAILGVACGNLEGDPSSGGSKDAITVPIAEAKIQSGCPAFVSSATEGAEIGLRNGTQKGDAAQSFIIDSDKEVRGINLFLKKRLAVGVTKLDGDVIVTIESSKVAPLKEGLETQTPDGVPLVVASMKADDLKLTTEKVTFDFANPVFLKANTRYWVRVSANYPHSNETLALWSATAGATKAPYGPGQALIYFEASSAWSTIDAALNKQSMHFAFRCVSIEN